MTVTPDQSPPRRPRPSQLRVVLTTVDLPGAVAFYRDALGLVEAEAISGPDGAQVVILEAGRATVELANVAQADFIAAVETRGVPSSAVRLAFEVEDSAEATAALAGAGATLVAEPVLTPWNSLNARVQGPDGLHVTVFQELGTPAGAVGAAGADLVGRDVTGVGEGELLRWVVDLATRNAEAGLEPFAALAVREGRVVGAGMNTAEGDPTTHAETHAVRQARRPGSSDGAGTVVYSSCEPCAVCRAVAATAGVDQVVFAAGKDLVPDALDDGAGDLVAALAAARPGLVRAGRTTMTAEALAVPFTTYLGRGQRPPTRST